MICSKLVRTTTHSARIDSDSRHGSDFRPLDQGDCTLKPYLPLPSHRRSMDWHAVTLTRDKIALFHEQPCIHDVRPRTHFLEPVTGPHDSGTLWDSDRATHGHPEGAVRPQGGCSCHRDPHTSAGAPLTRSTPHTARLFSGRVTPPMRLLISMMCAPLPVIMASTLNVPVERPSAQRVLVQRVAISSCLCAESKEGQLSPVSLHQGFS